MNPQKSSPLFWKFIWLILLVFLQISSYAQQNETDFNNDNFTIPSARLYLTLYDTILPTLGNEGLGLIHFEGAYLKTWDNITNATDWDGDPTLAIRQNRFTESEMKFLKDELQNWENKYNPIMIKELKRQQWQVDMEGIIRGSNSRPPF